MVELTPAGLIPLTLLAAAAMAWWVNLRARSEALRHCRRTCLNQGLELLDDTVALERYRLTRDPEGRLTLGRVYRFEFSAPERERGRGWISLVGARVVAVEVERPDGHADYDLPGS
ncbi:DUF3301 domain-containing protein [Arhodomonas sp. SL1]|uniref:DUF3301 domain-containing protein n=1 Tax=Arhodomonas sp. SL1 TaxID=3425691 RepID=UPI003F884E4C